MSDDDVEWGEDIDNTETELRDGGSGPVAPRAWPLWLILAIILAAIASAANWYCVIVLLTA